LGHRLSLLAILPLVLLAACHEQAGKARQAAARPLPVVTATTTAWPQVVRVPATVSAVDTAVLASRTGGWVSAVTVDAGTRVARGALLVAVDVPAARGQLAEAQSRLAAAKAALTQAAADESRYAALSKTHAASAQQYDIARRAAITARAELQAAQSGLLAAEANFGYAEIRAPFAGVVAEKKVWLGDFVAPGAPLLTLASDTPEIRAHVSADIFPALKLGELAEVTIDGQTQPATVTRLVDTADPATRTHLIELHLAPGVSAPFGAYADLRLTLGTAPQLTVPQSALIRRADLPGVFVVDAGGHARFRLVRFGAVRDGRVAITAGLSGGETVVLAPPADLVDGTPVHPEAAPAAASGAGSSRG
jgi:RND family efflux transporter MFP subunit